MVAHYSAGVAAEQGAIAKYIPHLVVTVPSVNDSGPAAGATFTLSATVRNAGGESSEPTTLRPSWSVFEAWIVTVPDPSACT